MTLRTLILLAPLSGILPAPAHAQWLASRVDAHAPIGVMFDHRHEKGEMMLSFRYMPMWMEGSLVGTSSIENSEIVSPTGEDFLATPTKMDMTMLMAGVMFAPSDKVTLNAMLPFKDNSMENITRPGGIFTTTSGGVGDLALSAIVGLKNWGRQRLHANLGVTVPTGSITQADMLPTSNGMDVQLPYPMQIGSGTWDIVPGITWLGQGEKYSWGAQASGVIRTGTNDRDYRLGDQFNATAWFAVPLVKAFSASIRGLYSSWGNIDGADPAPSVNPAVTPVARTDLRGGSRASAGLGVNWYVYRKAGLRLAAEALLPFYQNLDGPQLKSDWTLVVGIQAVPKH